MAELFSEVSQKYEKVEKYNPYHGSDGRFTSGGGSKTTVPYKDHSFTGKNGVKRTISSDMDDNSSVGRKLKSDCSRIAKSRISKAKLAEPKITGDLKEIASGNGGKLKGLTHRLKTQRSLTRKLVSECKEQSDKKGRDVPPEHAAQRMYDINRYTVTASENKLTNTIIDTLGNLEKKGYSIQRIKNTMKDKDVNYRGVNCVLQTKDGIYFELQFHTNASLRVKEKVNHPLYEEQRKDNTPQKRKDELDRIMIKNSNNIPTPKNIDLIRNVDYLPVEKSAGRVYRFYDPRQ